MSSVLKSELADRADRYLEANHQRFGELGGHFFEVFRYDRDTGRLSAQERNLQQITCSATRFADIEDFVKNQMGKGGSSAEPWRRGIELEGQREALGSIILRQFQELRTAAEGVPADERLSYRLRLARGWVRAVVAEYLYRIALDQVEATS